MKIAFVCPFYGPDASGGAEFAARSLAWRFAGSGMQVEVLTTCLLDLPHGITGAHHPPGTSDDGPVTVRRFPVDAADMSHFGLLNELIISRVPLTWEEELQFMSRHVSSLALMQSLAANAGAYDFFCFIPYLFGTSCFGAAAVPPGKRVLIPCFHDEGYARLRLVHRLAGAVDRLVFNAPAEARFALRTFDLPPGKGVTIGLGMETDIRGDAQRFRSRFGINERFILYAGRRDTTKNVHTLIDFFLRYRRRRKEPLKLVLIGSAALPGGGAASSDLVDLGFVSEQEKLDAYAAADVFCQPSLNESFSYVLMEAWLCGTPCLVHERCEVTRDHVVQSAGGLVFGNAADFSAAMDRLLEDTTLCREMAESGRRYVLEHYAWPRIVERFLEEVFITTT